LRLEEVVRVIAQDQDQADLLGYLRAGVFLCGGGARIPGLAQLASQVLELPVSIGKTTSVNGLKSTLDQPEFATPIGLVKFGSFKLRKRDTRPSLAQNLKNVFSKLLPR
jgi:cell division protein FtsA